MYYDKFIPHFINRAKMRDYIRPSQMDKIFFLQKKDKRDIKPSSFIAKVERENLKIKFITKQPKAPMYDGHKLKLYRILDVLHLAYIQGYVATQYTDTKVVLQGIHLEIFHAQKTLANIQDEIKASQKQLRLQTGDLSDFGICVKQPKYALLPYDAIISASKQDFRVCGIYFLIKNDEIVYIGQSVNIFGRLQGHSDKDYDSVAFVACPKSQLDILETLYILNYQPKLNGRMGNDGRLSTPISLPQIIEKLSKAEL